MQLRTAVPGDLPALRRIFRRSSLSNEGDRAVLIAHPEVLELSGDGVAEGRTRVAVGADGTILGFATWRRLRRGALELDDLFVDPDWMRRGIGRRLVEDLVALATRERVPIIEVTANPHADAFYRSVGFVRVSETETRFGPAVRMQLSTGWRPS